MGIHEYERPILQLAKTADLVAGTLAPPSPDHAGLLMIARESVDQVLIGVDRLVYLEATRQIFRYRASIAEPDTRDDVSVAARTFADQRPPLLSQFLSIDNATLRSLLLSARSPLSCVLNPQPSRPALLGAGISLPYGIGLEHVLLAEPSVPFSLAIRLLTMASRTVIGILSRAPYPIAGARTIVSRTAISVLCELMRSARLSGYPVSDITQALVENRVVDHRLLFSLICRGEAAFVDHIAAVYAGEGSSSESPLQALQSAGISQGSIEFFALARTLGSRLTLEDRGRAITGYLIARELDKLAPADRARDIAEMIDDNLDIEIFETRDFFEPATDFRSMML